jgi:hypothetical protein
MGNAEFAVRLLHRSSRTFFSSFSLVSPTLLEKIYNFKLATSTGIIDFGDNSGGRLTIVEFPAVLRHGREG